MQAPVGEAGRRGPRARTRRGGRTAGATHGGQTAEAVRTHATGRSDGGGRTGVVLAESPQGREAAHAPDTCRPWDAPSDFPLGRGSTTSTLRPGTADADSSRPASPRSSFVLQWERTRQCAEAVCREEAIAPDLESPAEPSPPPPTTNPLSPQDVAHASLPVAGG